MYFLYAPIMLDKIVRQPIQQFGMRGLFAQMAEVVESRNQAATEMALPNPIHHNAAGEAIARFRHPFRQGRAAGCLVFGVGQMEPARQTGTEPAAPVQLFRPAGLHRFFAGLFLIFKNFLGH